MEIPDKGLFVTMYDEKNSYIQRGEMTRIAVYCNNDEELKIAAEIAKHYKTDFTRVNVSTTAGKHNDKTHIDKKTYAQFLEFCIREIEWVK